MFSIVCFLCDIYYSKPFHAFIVSQAIPSPPALIRYSIRLTNVNGKLTSLSEYQGFRKFVKAKAVELHVGGTIQRYHERDVMVVFEGYADDVREFYNFLKRCKMQDMIESFAEIHYETLDDMWQMVSENFSFKILKNFSKTVRQGGTIITGRYSGEDFDKITVFSADSEILKQTDI